MTSSKFASEGDTTGDLPPLQRPENGVDEEDDEGFQTVVSKRTARLLQQQQQYQAQSQNRHGRKGHGGYGHHGYGYGNGNGRHYYRQNGPPSYHGSSSSNGTNSSSGSSIPEELPKEKEPNTNLDQDQKTAADSHTPPPRTITTTVVPAPSLPVIAWARVAAGDVKPPPPKHVPEATQSQSTGKSTGSSSNNISATLPPELSHDKWPLPLVSNGNGNGRHSQSSHGSSSGTNSSAGSSIPEELPKEKEPNSGQDKKHVDDAQPVTGTARSFVPAPAPSVSVWARIAAGNMNSPPDVPQITGPSSNNSANRPAELSDEKWPLPLVSSNGVGDKGQGHDATGLTEKLRQSRHSSGDAMSSSGCDQGTDGTDGEGSKKKKKNKKASKPKWVPLILEDEQPKPPPPKPKKKITRAIPQQHRNGDAHVGAIGGDESSDCATPTEGHPRPKSHISGSGPNRNNNGRNNGSKGKHRSYHNNYYKFYKETSDPSQRPADVNGEEGYSDYPTEFTPMNALYPMTEFVMPYANYATYSPPPDAQSYSYAPIAIDDIVLTQMIQQQIEYYFSEENLERDFYLRRKMDSDGYIPISLISSFYRIQSLTQDYYVVLNAIKASELIEVKEEEEGCASARPVENPTKWPIVDTAAASIPPPPPIVKTFLTTVNATSATTTQ